jgi:hypothetical protein
MSTNPFFRSPLLNVNLGAAATNRVLASVEKKKKKKRLIRALAITGVGALVVGGAATVVLVKSKKGKS